MKNPIIAVYTRKGYPSANILNYMPDFQYTLVNTLIISGPNGYHGKIVYNDPPFIMFNEKGEYVGDIDWPANLIKFAHSSNISPDRIYLSLSNSAISTLAAMPSEYLLKVMTWLKSHRISGIDMDCENWGQPGGLNPMDSAVKNVTLAAIKASLTLTAAPYNQHNEWIEWCNFVTYSKGRLSWLNLQCYAGGCCNDPVQWANAFKPVPIVAGYEAKSSESNDKGQLSPDEVVSQFEQWQQELPGNMLSGAFVWEFSMIYDQKNTYKYTLKEYAEAMVKGLKS